MTTKKSLKSLATILGFATVTAAATLAVCAPRTTFADGDDADRMGEWTEDGTKFQDIVVKGEIVRDTHAKSGWMVMVTAKNTASVPETMALEMDMDRSFVTPMARVQAEQATLYKQEQSVTVPAQATVTIARPVPAWVVPQLETADKMQKAREKAQKVVDDGGDWQQEQAVLGAPYPSFAVTFYRGGASKPAAEPFVTAHPAAAPQPAVAAPPAPAAEPPAAPAPPGPVAVAR